jgi:threonine dehydratase
MAQLSRAKAAKGVIASSAGNHAQGVALAAQKLGCRAVIVMPVTSPRIKVDAVARAARKSCCTAIPTAKRRRTRAASAARGLTFVHPYDDPDVIAGPGHDRHGDPAPDDAPDPRDLRPVGGGGLISGHRGVCEAPQPAIAVIGVEPTDADAMARSLQAGSASCSITSGSSPTASR